MLIGTLVVSLLLCVGLALAVLYVVAAPHLRASGNRLAVRLAERVDRAGAVVAALARAASARLAETVQRQVAQRREVVEDTGSAQLNG